MKMVIMAFWTFILVAVSAAQPEPDTLWTRTYGGVGTDAGMCVRLTTDGNYVVAGYTQSSGPDDMYLVKINGSGDTLWTRVIDLGNIEQANSVWPTDDGGYLLAGSIQYMDGGNTAMLLVKTNSGGDTAWTRAYGWSGSDKGHAVQQTPDGGFIMVGSTRSAAGDDDACLVKINTAGDTLWTRTYAAAHDDVALSVECTADGGYVLAGYSTLPPQVTPAFVLKTGATGNLQWRREYGGLFNMAVFAEQTSDGGYMVAGTGVSPGIPHLASYLMKTDSAGNSLWTHLHSVSPLDEWIYAAQRASDGGYVMAGWIGNLDSAAFGMEITRMDSLGSVLWTRTYGSGTGASAASVVESADHGYVATGNAQTSTNGYDMYVVGTGPEGMVLVYPNDGETLAIGRPLEIGWNGSVHGGNVSLQVNRSYPSAAWESVVASASNSGRYTWIVSGDESNHVRFRIQHLTDPALSDTSDADMSFRIPRIHLLWPNGGETVLSGVRDTVRFERVLVTDNLRLLLNRDYPNGVWDPVIDNMSGDSTGFWIVQLPGGTHCRLRLVSMSDSTLADTSDADFLLRAPQMTLTAPNGGEQLPVGTAYEITWSAPEHQGNIRITLNRDYPSGTWEIIAASVANSGQHSWTPAAPASDHCRVRISTVFDPQSRVESAGDFAVTAASANDHADELPATFALDAPYPNPFNSQTVLSFSIPARGEVTLILHDLTGRAVRTMIHGVVERGHHQILFDGTGLPSGMYFYRLQWGPQSQVKKMVLLK
ncbi:T9SS type A sorting domain-containing protein [bacterium]|nr:T9SS type A sorting domain-containing protein [bacterium]MBU1985251.1 T9SS type A sorting domain-containing protein [bacterium]